MSDTLNWIIFLKNAFCILRTRVITPAPVAYPIHVPAMGGFGRLAQFHKIVVFCPKRRRKHQQPLVTKLINS